MPTPKPDTKPSRPTKPDIKPTNPKPSNSGKGPDKITLPKQETKPKRETTPGKGTILGKIATPDKTSDPQKTANKTPTKPTEKKSDKPANPSKPPVVNKGPTPQPGKGTTKIVDPTKFSSGKVITTNKGNSIKLPNVVLKQQSEKLAALRKEMEKLQKQNAQQLLKKLPEPAKKIAQEAKAKSTLERLKSLLPKKADQPGTKATTKTVAPANTKTALRRITPGEVQTLSDKLDKNNFRDQRLLDNIVKNRPLSPFDRRHAERRLDAALNQNPPDARLVAALSNALRADDRRKKMDAILGKLGGLGGVILGGGGLPGQLSGPGGTLLPVPPGFDPNCGGTLFPNNPADPSQGGTLVAPDPSSILPNLGGGNQHVEIPADVTHAVFDTRRLQISNGTQKKLQVAITYQALNEDEELVQQTVEIEVEAGQVVLVQQGEWILNARSVRLVASDGEQEWRRFENEDLILCDENYQAPEIETLTVSFT
jgi:hypothetical protein